MQDVTVLGGLAFVGGVALEGGGLGGAVAFATTALGTIYSGTEIIDGGSKPNDVVHATSSLDPTTNVTTSTKVYEDGSYVHNKFHNDDGSSVI